MSSRTLTTAVLATLALALTASSASAGPIGISAEPVPAPAADCGEVTIVVHDVSGGCRIELRSTEHAAFVIYTPTPLVVASCNWHLEARIGADGTGYVTDAAFSEEDPQTNPPCVREPCDEGGEGSHPMLPWPLEIVENGAGDEEFIVEICVRASAIGEGNGLTRCKVSLELGQVADHEIEIGGDPSEEFCEISPIPFVPVSVRDAHLLYEEDSEAIEIAHDSESGIVVSPETQPVDCGSPALAGHVVSGGCHMELESTGNGIPMHGYLPAKVTFTHCEWSIEAEVGQDGEGYATQVVLTAPHAGDVPCTRVPCDEANGALLPWPLHIREHAAGSEEVEMEICVRAATEAPGFPGGRCEVHLRLTDLGGHRYQAGGTSVERFCENNPPTNPTPHPTLPVPVSIEGSLVTPTIGAEEVEITH